MSKKYDVMIYDAATYRTIEADSKEQAKEIALEWWKKRVPAIFCFQSEKEE